MTLTFGLKEVRPSTSTYQESSHQLYKCLTETASNTKSSLKMYKLLSTTKEIAVDQLNMTSVVLITTLTTTLMKSMLGLTMLLLPTQMLHPYTQLVNLTKDKFS